jgi:hypothetical protein
MEKEITNFRLIKIGDMDGGSRRQWKFSKSILHYATLPRKYYSVSQSSNIQ